uniref:Uncharacterized protein n=1 Tax=Oryza nivara TaxID=4536 RepID=A0A0E0HDD6_ORYNI
MAGQGWRREPQVVAAGLLQKSRAWSRSPRPAGSIVVNSVAACVLPTPRAHPPPAAVALCCAGGRLLPSDRSGRGEMRGWDYRRRRRWRGREGGE